MLQDELKAQVLARADAVIRADGLVVFTATGVLDELGTESEVEAALLDLADEGEFNATIEVLCQNQGHVVTTLKRGGFERWQAESASLGCDRCGDYADEGLGEDWFETRLVFTRTSAQKKTLQQEMGMTFWELIHQPSTTTAK